MRKQRYLEKIENLEKQIEFIESHKIEDEVTERALLYSLQVSVEICMDIIAMKVKDTGLVVEDNYTNINKLAEENVLEEKEAEILRKYNGIRNIIVHKYNKIEISIIKKAFSF
ncbi:MAG: DUF86 domain-containing protein [Theionarchaea archaeon]|nr:DUF86 domain-containing protein [Theionarchaea archaeon]